MTMRLIIKNDDQVRTARVSVIGSTSPATDIKPGETQDFYLYKGHELKVEELQDEEPK
jgi:hypothetical protein